VSADDRDLRVVALLGCAALFAACVGAYSAIVGDRGSDLWHQAIREDIRAGARIVSDARSLYEDEAAVAHRIAAYELRARELRQEVRTAANPAASILDAEARAQHETADVLSGSSPLADSPARAVDLDGGDLLARFAEIRDERSAELKALDPEAAEASGADDQDEAVMLTATTLGAGLALLLGALAEAVPRLRRRLVNGGFAALGVSILAVILVLL
jgi:hypothetical protein